MIAVIFEVEPADGKTEDYLAHAAELRPLADDVDGFVSIERFASMADPRRILSLSFWRDEDAVQAWRNLGAHRKIQTAGRQGLFQDYRLRVAHVDRDYGMHSRAEAPADSKSFHAIEPSHPLPTTPPGRANDLDLSAKIDLVRRLKVAKWDKDIPALLALYHPNVVLEQPSLGSRTEGLAELKVGLEAFARHFPDYDRSFEGFAESGDTLVSWGSTTVTLAGQFNGETPNGEKASTTTFVLFRFEDGKIVYEGHYWDLAGLARSSGITAEAIFNAGRGQGK